MILKLNNFDFFLTWENYKKLHEKALLKKDDGSEDYALWLFSSLKKDSEEYKEKINLYIEVLIQISIESKQEFQKNWLSFELNKKEARDNCWNIINDFCSLKNEFYLRDNRTFEETLKGDYLGETYKEYPLGKAFSIIGDNTKKDNWWSVSKTQKNIEIIINTNKVLEIKGCFENFTILFDNFTINFENRKTIMVIT